MKTPLIPTLYLALVVLLFSCQRNPDSLLHDDNADTLEIPGSKQPDRQVITSLTGRVLDENEEPMKDAHVSAGGRITFTDEHGVFRLTDVRVSEQSTFVQVKKEGYFPGSRTLVSQSEGKGFVTIKLVRKKLTGSFNAASGAEVTIKTASTITFQPQSVITSSGEAYNGEVFVYTSVLDPTVADFTAIMPGDLRGIDADSQIVALRSYGMVNVSLETSAGETLQLAKGKPAGISLQIPASLLAQAPAQIPLWHFSEYDGKWREEGKATLKNGMYTGTVSHFSTWNFDDPLDFVFISLKIHGSNSSKLPYLRLRISDPASGSYAEGYSDSTGTVLMWAPRGVSLNVELFNECGELIFSKAEAALHVDKDLGIITLSPSKLVTIKGKVIDCRLQPVSSAEISLQYEGLNYTANAIDGAFEISLNRCNSQSTSARLFAIDHSTLNTSEPQLINVSGTEVQAGAVKVCGNNAEEYAYIRFDSDSVLLVRPLDSVVFVGGPYTEITFMDGLPVNEHQYAVNVRLMYQIPQQYESSSHLTTVTWKNRIYYVNSSFQYNIKEYGEKDEVIWFTFSGLMQWDKDPTDVHTVSGEVRIRRPY